MEKPRDRRACDVVHDYRDGCECVDANNSRPHAGGARQSRYLAVAEWRGRDRTPPATAEDRLPMWPVSRRVNKTGSGDDDPTLIDEVAA
jgi:hypothetical protein